MLRPLSLIGVAFAMCALCSSASAQESSASEKEAISEEQVDFKQFKNPVANTRKSIGRGKMTYGRHCTPCHGNDGKALINIVAEAPDLTEPRFWMHGTSEGEVFRSIRDGVGIEMPPYKKKIRREDDIWHLVNFIQSLWPKSIRPEVVEEPPPSSETDETKDRHEQEGKS